MKFSDSPLSTGVGHGTVPGMPVFQLHPHIFKFFCSQHRLSPPFFSCPVHFLSHKNRYQLMQLPSSILLLWIFMNPLQWNRALSMKHKLSNTWTRSCTKSWNKWQ